MHLETRNQSAAGLQQGLCPSVRGPLPRDRTCRRETRSDAPQAHPTSRKRKREGGHGGAGPPTKTKRPRATPTKTSDKQRAIASSRRPSRIRSTRWARVATCGLCVARTTVWPSRVTRESSSMMTPASSRSRLAVGSSAQTSAGRCTSALASATRCWSPPWSWSGRRGATWASPSTSSISSARRRASRAPAPSRSSGISTLSTAVRTGRRLKAWKTKPMCRARYAVRSRSDMEQMSRPSMSTSPPLKRSRPARQLSSVVLPEPDGPTTATISPRATSRSTPRSASTTAAPR